MTRIDAHHHFWALSRGDYGWLTPALAAIHRDFGPDDLAPLATRHGIGRTVLVQAAPTVAETEYLLSLAAATPWVGGVVGWVDFEAPDAPETIARLADHGSLVGLRPMIQDIDDPDWMLRPALGPAFEAMEGSGLAFDALVLPHHLDRLSRLLARHPDLRVVIDHAAKPRIRHGEIVTWASGMARLAEETSAHCKLSGLLTEAGPGADAEALRPYVEHLLATFGPARLIWGSDWPVCTLAAPYDRWVETTDALLADLANGERAAVLGGNAATFYRLDAAA